MKVKLLLLSTEIKPNEFNLAKLPAKIGRGKEATLRLIHPQVSRLHCELFEEEEVLHVRDLASLNGTFVDEERVSDFVAVPSGARLMIGSIEFQVLCGDDIDRLPPPGAAAGMAGDGQAAEGGEPIEELEMATDQDEGAGTPSSVWKLTGEAPSETAPAEDTGTVDLDWLLAPDGASSAAAAAPAPAAPPTPAQPAAAKVAAPKPVMPPTKPAAAAKPAAAPKTATVPKPAAPAKPAAPDPTEQIQPPAEQSPATDAESEDLDDFFKSIM